MAQEWDIKPCSGHCAQCGRPFEERESFVSALFEKSEERLKRQDFCLSCWEQARFETPPFSLWRTVYRKPPAAKPEPLRKETAESLLRKLVEREDPVEAGMMFVLAVMLERKRLLVEKDVQERNGETVRVYEHRKTGEVFLIPDPRMRLDELEQVQERLAQRLAAMLRGEEVAPEHSTEVAESAIAQTGEPGAVGPGEWSRSSVPEDG